MVNQPCGHSIDIDITDCDLETISSKQKIQDFVIQLCKTLSIERIDDCMLTDITDGIFLLQKVASGVISAFFLTSGASALITLFVKGSPVTDELLKLVVKTFGTDISFIAHSTESRGFQ